MTNKQMVSASKRRDKLVAKQQELKRHARAIQAKLQRLDELLVAGRQVKEIVNGVGIYTLGKSIMNVHYSSLGDDFPQRSATVYANASIDGAFGISIGGKEIGWLEQNFGSGWNEKAATNMAKRWVIHGERPPAHSGHPSAPMAS
jgi:hypothetical protein